MYGGNKSIYPEAVWCDELYAEQIEKEDQDDDIENNFSRVFKPHDGWRWICPNVTSDIDFVNPDQKS